MSSFIICTLHQISLQTKMYRDKLVENVALMGTSPVRTSFVLKASLKEAIWGTHIY